MHGRESVGPDSSIRQYKKSNRRGLLAFHVFVLIYTSSCETLDARRSTGLAFHAPQIHDGAVGWRRGRCRCMGLRHVLQLRGGRSGSSGTDNGAVQPEEVSGLAHYPGEVPQISEAEQQQISQVKDMLELVVTRQAQTQTLVRDMAIDMMETYDALQEKLSRLGSSDRDANARQHLLALGEELQVQIQLVQGSGLLNEEYVDFMNSRLNQSQPAHGPLSSDTMDQSSHH